MAKGTDITSSVVRFDSTVVSVNDTPLVLLPAAASASLPSRGQVAVEGTIDGHAITTVVEPDGNRGHWIKLDPDLGLVRGDVVSIELAPAPVWPEPEVPRDFRSALDAAPDIADLWTSITPMARWEWVRWIQATKNPSTRARRIEVGISKLRSGQRRPCCFDLSSCTDPGVARGGKLAPVD